MQAEALKRVVNMLMNEQMTLMGLVKDFNGLLIARIFLGVTEAGLFPGVVFCEYPLVKCLT